MPDEAAAPAAEAPAPTTEATPGSAGTSTEPVDASGNPIRDIAPSNPTDPPPAEAPAPTNNGLLGSDDADDFVPDDGVSWRSELPEEFREDPVFAEHTSMEAFLKSHKNLNSMLSNKAIIKPGDDATPEELVAWNKHIGVPDTAALYEKSPLVTGMSAEAQNAYFGEGGFEALYQGFFDASLTQGQVDKVMAQYDQILRGQGDRYGAELETNKAKEQNETVTALKLLWPGTYDKEMHQVKTMMEKFPEFKDTLDKNGLNSNLGIIKMLHQMSNVFGESSIDGTVNHTQPTSFKAQNDELNKQVESGKITKSEYKEQRSALFKANRKAMGGPQ